MKVLSLSQPWANLTMIKYPGSAHALKSWETRSWVPSCKNESYIRQHGLLIHASSTWKRPQKQLIQSSPFNVFIKPEELVFGAIIGWVEVGEIITTDEWLKKDEVIQKLNLFRSRYWLEELFGDYSYDRWAWEFKSFRKLKEPIVIPGSLSLWNFDLNMEYAQFED
jgi:activating signal cointegrator 1